MAAASANECPPANALVSTGRSFDAESPDLRRERYARPGLCRRGALGSPPVSESGLTPHVLDGLLPKVVAAFSHERPTLAVVYAGCGAVGDLHRCRLWRPERHRHRGAGGH